MTRRESRQMGKTPKSSGQAASDAGRTLLLVLLVVALSSAAALLILKRSSVPQPAPARAVPESPLPAPAVSPVPSAPGPPPLEAAPVPDRLEPAPAAPPESKPGERAAAPKRAQAGQKEPIKDELARMALIFVGFDPEAEAYWYAAINDNNLSAHERQDLIEDLNEEGFANPRRPAPEELPLILNRLRLIEQVAADAMDQVNADAFAEAYKDLVNMRDRLLGQ